jgi:hypothetical protein
MLGELEDVLYSPKLSGEFFSLALNSRVETTFGSSII